MKKFFLGLALCGLTTPYSTVTAGDLPWNNWSVGAGVSTLGVGAHVGYKVNSFFSIRGVLNYAQVDRKISDMAMTYSGHMRLFTAGLLANWHPIGNGLRLTAGVLYNQNRFHVKAETKFSFTVNGTTYTPAQIGSIAGHIDFRPVAPYIGVGYDGSHSCGGLGFTADVGVMLQGSARGRVKITGLLEDNAEAINNAKDRVLKDVNKLKFIKAYPVISIGLVYGCD